MGSESGGAMGVGDGGSCDQDYQTDLRPGQGGRDDAGEGEGGGVQAGGGSEVGEVSVGGDEDSHFAARCQNKAHRQSKK